MIFCVVKGTALFCPASLPAKLILQVVVPKAFSHGIAQTFFSPFGPKLYLIYLCKVFLTDFFFIKKKLFKDKTCWFRSSSATTFVGAAAPALLLSSRLLCLLQLPRLLLWLCANHHLPINWILNIHSSGFHLVFPGTYYCHEMQAFLMF